MSADKFVPYPGFTVSSGDGETVTGPSASEVEETPVESTEDVQADESETSEELEETQDSEEQESESEEESENEEEVEEQKPKKKSGYKKRIDKLGREKSEAMRERDYWREQALKGQSPKQESQDAPKPQQAEDSSKPKLSDFDSITEYSEALADWKYDQREKAKEAKAQENKAKADFEEAQATFIDRAKKFAADKPDWNDRLAEATEAVPFKHDLAKLIHESENGPELLYALTGDLAEMERINNLSGAALGREIAKLEMRLESSKAAPKPEIKKSNAPKPIAPVSGKASATKKSLSDDIPFSEYERIRLEQLRNKR